MGRRCLAICRFAFWVAVIIAGSQSGGTCVAQTGAAAPEKGASLHTQVPRLSHWQTDKETDQTLFECTARTSHLELARDTVEDPSSNQHDVVLYRMRSALCVPFLFCKCQGTLTSHPNPPLFLSGSKRCSSRK